MQNGPFELTTHILISHRVRTVDKRTEAWRQMLRPVMSCLNACSAPLMLTAKQAYGKLRHSMRKHQTAVGGNQENRPARSRSSRSLRARASVGLSSSNRMSSTNRRHSRSLTSTDRTNQ